MNNFNELKKLIEINSWTKNKEGVDKGDHTIYERASKESFEKHIKLVSEILIHFLEGRI